MLAKVSELALDMNGSEVDAGATEGQALATGAAGQLTELRLLGGGEGNEVNEVRRGLEVVAAKESSPNASALIALAAALVEGANDSANPVGVKESNSLNPEGAGGTYIDPLEAVAPKKSLEAALVPVSPKALAEDVAGTVLAPGNV